MRWLFVVTVLVGCSLPTELWRPSGQPYGPPPVYAEWWSEVVACVDVGDAALERISFFEVVGVTSFDTPDYGPASGRWVPPHDIYIAAAHVYIEKAVKHEMVHDLLGGGRADDARFLACSGVTHA